MGKIAFVFSGQGDQYPGMGKYIYDKYSFAKSIFDMCESLRPGTIQQCFCGTEDELKETKNTQPCLFAMEFASASVLTEHVIMPSAFAGFSLGEIVAASFAGVFSPQDGFALVCKRGQIMQEAAERFDTSMAAVLKLENSKVVELCSKFDSVYPVNFNCPGQVSVSGLTSQMSDFYAEVKSAGGRALPLKVKGAFHSPFMSEASEKFAEALEKYEANPANAPLYSNLSAKPYEDNAKELLSKQISSPVLWEETIRNMISNGIDTFIEIGPGKTLTNMIAKIDSNVKAYSVAELDKLLAEVKPC